MGVPVVDLLNLLQGWQKYVLLIAVIALDAGIASMVDYTTPFGQKFTGLIVAPINFVVHMVFGVKGFEITSFQLLIICVVFPVLMFMLKMALNNASK